MPADIAKILVTCTDSIEGKVKSYYSTPYTCEAGKWRASTPDEDRNWHKMSVTEYDTWNLTCPKPGGQLAADRPRDPAAFHLYQSTGDIRQKRERPYTFQSQKFLSIARPTSPLFSWWNWLAIRLSLPISPENVCVP